ncbi:MFS transporter [Clavibacter californiensis]|nr:MFS transporter [Clavibacter californiensis]UKF80897.1 MFS transporter [Clavibacter californiensis]
MFLIGLVIFGVASLAAAFAPTPGILIAARAILAVGAASMMPATLALIRLTFEDERERSIGIGVWGSTAVVGSALGPIVSGLLLSRFPWGSVFLINVPVGIAAIIATVVLAPHNDADASKKWDLLSSVLALVALVGMVLAIKEIAKGGSVPVIALALAGAVIGGTLFVRRQLVLPYPLLVFGIFRNPAFLAGTLAAGFSMFTTAGVQLVTTQRFQLVAGFTPLEAGFLVVAVAVASGHPLVEVRRPVGRLAPVEARRSNSASSHWRSSAKLRTARSVAWLASASARASADGSHGRCLPAACC